MDNVETAAPAGSTASGTNSLRYLFQFHRGCTLTGWRSIDDVVMGGVSSSALEVKDSALVFSGQVSLANKGGFASVRSPPLESSIPDAEAFVLRVMGDDKSYKINVKTDAAFDGLQYQARFQPRAGMWETKRLPIARFVATYRGRRVPDAPQLSSDEVRSVGLMISERQAGPFTLKVAWIAVELVGPLTSKAP